MIRLPQAVVGSPALPLLGEMQLCILLGPWCVQLGKIYSSAVSDKGFTGTCKHT